MSEEIQRDSVLEQNSDYFNKKDIIFSETLGVCRVDEVTNLSQQNGDTIAYYGLRSIFDKSKVSYIPMKNHSVQLRPLITACEAQKIKESSYEQESLLVQQEVDYVLKQQEAFNGGKK